MTEPTTRRAVPRRIQIVIWALLAGLLIMMGIRLVRAQQGTVQPGQVIQNFTLPLYSGYELDGKTEVNFDDLRGRVVVVNFWASWCKPCEQEAAELQQAWTEYQASGEVIFLGVDYLDTEEGARVFFKKFGPTYPNGPDLGTKIAQYFRIKGIPETYFIDKQGVLRYVQIGPFDNVEQIRAQIDPLLK